MVEQGTKTNQMCRPNDSIGTLRNYDGDSDGNFKKGINFCTAKQQLRTSSPPFSTFLCHCYLTTTWNDRILSVLENGDGKTIVCTISVWTRTWSPLLKLISLFKVIGWLGIIGKKFERFEVYFSGTSSSLASPCCRIVSSLLTATWTSLINYRTLEGAYWADCVDDVDNDQTLQPAVVWCWYNLWTPLLPWLRSTQKETTQPVNYIKSQRHYYIMTITYHLLYIFFV